MQTLYDIYKSQGKSLPGTVDERFADPNFASAAQQAGITKDQYRINSGNADYNTKIASLYGKPLSVNPSQQTTPTQPQQSTPINPTPTSPLDSIFKIPQTGNNYETDPRYKSSVDILSGGGYGMVDEAQIRRDKISQMQDRINSINQVYNNTLATAKLQGQGRVGESTALLANRGLAGSGRGAAMANNVVTANNAIEQTIEAERVNAISAIENEASNYAVAEAQRRRQALDSGAKEYIAYIKEQDAVKKDNVNGFAEALYAQGIDPTKLKPGELEAALKNAKGISSQDIINAYSKIQNTRNKEYLTDDIKEYEFAVSRGYKGTPVEYKQELQKIKATGELTPYQKFSATQSISKDNDKRTTTSRELLRQAQLIESSYQNLLAGGDKSLNTQAIVTAFNKILDPTSVVRESEYDRTSQGQSLIQQLQGKIENISKGGAGVTNETLREAADIAKTYIANANKSIELENQRAKDLANSFGLNSDFVGTPGTYNGVSETVGRTPTGGISF